MSFFRIEDSVREDLAILKNSPLLKKGTQFVGLKFDTDTGKLTVVE
jgi:carbonic anhydrase